MPVEPLPCEPSGSGPGPEPEGPDSCCAPSITTAQACLEDGTPIGLVLRAACVCGDTPEAEPEVAGWLDLATGAFTPGAVPPGAGPCSTGSDCASVSSLHLCDYTPNGDCARFVRWLVRDCDGQVTASTDTGLDGTTPYTPVGEVGECRECRPTPMCAQLVGLSGPETWVMPERTESLSINVACGPITITDCAGNATVVNECGTGFQWAAPPTGGCEPPVLCTPFTVDVPEGAAVYINFVTPCGMGDES